MREEDAARQNDLRHRAATPAHAREGTCDSRDRLARTPNRFATGRTVDATDDAIYVCSLIRGETKLEKRRIGRRLRDGESGSYIVIEVDHQNQLHITVPEPAGDPIAP